MHTQNTFVGKMRIAVAAVAMAAVAAAAPATAQAAPHDTRMQQRTMQRQRTDSIRRPQAATEMHDMHTRMMASPLPVSIRQQGRLLRVESQEAQLLPIYTQNGIFYTAFRLSKGTNWLSGLPRGRYIINNQQFAIN